MSPKNLYYRACQSLHLRGSLSTLRRLERILPAPHSRLAVPFLFKGWGFFRKMRPIQSQWEIGELFYRVLRQRPRVVLEIGTCHGGTLYLWCQAAQPDALLVSVDLPGGLFGGGYRECRGAFYRAFGHQRQQLHLVRADSHAPETRERVREILGGQPVDFLFIDADHTYQGVKQDFDQYSPLVAPGGLIALHDIAPGNPNPQIQVPVFWQELKKRFAGATEWLDETPNGRRIGIGLVEWPGRP